MHNQENYIATETCDESSGCGCTPTGCGCGCGPDDHDHLHDSDVPFMFRILRPGDRVIELGCKGNENLVSMKEIIGDEGTATGIEIPGVSHTNDGSQDNGSIRIIRSEPDSIPLEKEVADVVIANEVFSRNGNAQKNIDEAYRLCDHNGVLLSSDYVYLKEPPAGLLQSLGSTDQAIRGARFFEDHMNQFVKSGFVNIEVLEARKIIFPESTLISHLDQDAMASYASEDTEYGIFHVTVIAEKPGTCEADTCCCNPEKNKV